MERTCYLIEKHRDQWVVSASGAKIMTCRKKSTALRTVRNATVLLHGRAAVRLDHEACCGQATAVDRVPISLALLCAFPACWFAGVAMSSFKVVAGSHDAQPVPQKR
jgi:hypothetical protein